MTVYSFDTCELDTEARELRRDGALYLLEPQAFEVLTYLLAHRERVVLKEELIEHVWQTPYISDAALTTRIKEARQGVGDDGRAQRVIRTYHRRGYRFVAEVDEHLAVGLPVPADEPAEQAPAIATVDAPPAPVSRQEIRFCTTSDGVSLAYATVGAGPPFVKAANWLTNLEYDLQSPVWRHLMTDLAEGRQFIRYDERGCGLSDWDVGDFGLDVWVEDLETTVDALGLERFPLLGISQGGAVAVAYAVRHPERVSHLILSGAFVDGNAVSRGGQSAELILGLVRAGWGKSGSVFSEVFSNVMLPGGASDHIQWLSDLQRVSTSTDNAVRFFEAFFALNAIDLLPQVRVPTLIAHSTGDRTVPFTQARLIAAGIPDSRLLPLDSDNHLLLEHEPARHVFREAVREFLAT